MRTNNTAIAVVNSRLQTIRVILMYCLYENTVCFLGCCQLQVIGTLLIYRMVHYAYIRPQHMSLAVVNSKLLVNSIWLIDWWFNIKWAVCKLYLWGEQVKKTLVKCWHSD